MRVNLARRNLYGDQHTKEMDVIFQSTRMVIARHLIENAQKPLFINDECVLENRYTAISFIEFGKWHIIDKVYNFNAVPTGFLARLVTPVVENLTYLSTLDLFMKVWITPENEYFVFGTKAFKEILQNGLLTENMEKKALEAMNNLIAGIKNREIPSSLMEEFALERENAHFAGI